LRGVARERSRCLAAKYCPAGADLAGWRPLRHHKKCVAANAEGVTFLSIYRLLRALALELRKKGKGDGGAMPSISTAGSRAAIEP
jgi:hypothetical protein